VPVKPTTPGVRYQTLLIVVSVEAAEDADHGAGSLDQMVVHVSRRLLGILLRERRHDQHVRLDLGRRGDVVLELGHQVVEPSHLVKKPAEQPDGTTVATEIRDAEMKLTCREKGYVEFVLRFPLLLYEIA
jgi:hypothetical protein